MQSNQYDLAAAIVQCDCFSYSWGRSLTEAPSVTVSNDDIDASSIEELVMLKLQPTHDGTYERDSCNEGHVTG